MPITIQPPIEHSGYEWNTAPEGLVPGLPDDPAWRARALDEVNLEVDLVRVEGLSQRPVDPPRWRWKGEHARNAWARLDGRAPTREAAMEAAASTVGPILSVYARTAYKQGKDFPGLWSDWLKETESRYDTRDP